MGLTVNISVISRHLPYIANQTTKVV